MGIAKSGDEKAAGCLKLPFNSSRFSATPQQHAIAGESNHVSRK
jgi:hypothetical protein